MNDNFTSLVFFTVLCQTAVGALIFRALIILKEGHDLATFDFGRIASWQLPSCYSFHLVLHFFMLENLLML